MNLQVVDMLRPSRNSAGGGGAPDLVPGRFWSSGRKTLQRRHGLCFWGVWVSEGRVWEPFCEGFSTHRSPMKSLGAAAPPFGVSGLALTAWILKKRAVKGQCEILD